MQGLILLCPQRATPARYNLPSSWWDVGLRPSWGWGMLWGGGGAVLAHRLVAGAGGTAARGLAGRPAHVPQRLALHPLEFPLGVMEADPEVKGDVGQHGRDESCKRWVRRLSTTPGRSPASGAGGGGGDLPCSRGLAMVARTAPWLSHACFASGHITISALSWPLKLKHCTGGGTGWSRGCSHPPPHPEPSTLPTQPPSAAPFCPNTPSPLCALIPTGPLTPPAPPPHGAPLSRHPRTCTCTLPSIPV